MFNCDVIWSVWLNLSCFLQGRPFTNESVAKLWISNKRNVVVNVVTYALMWSTWKLRNDLHFGRGCWSDPLSTSALDGNDESTEITYITWSPSKKKGGLPMSQLPEKFLFFSQFRKV
jgi:hypothetical protein